MEIKPEHAKGWEFAAGLAGQSVSAFSQARVDALGEGFEQQRRAADRAANAELFEMSLRLSPESREALKAKVMELAQAEGLV